ncbi:MAG: cupin domain-containing protein [candidate division Zixibacteria bacterium]|nr:cupin domain-containing protein [candidate division Zixibacteria bacterium]MCI0596755.1 cupin domain-containing protein [candidate division Zixibacteria bacterium]
MTERNFRISVEEALARLPTPEGKLFAPIFKRGDLTVEIYAPHGVDAQEPHTRDEIYFVAHGEGLFICEETRQPFGAGDFLFAPAGAVHRFEDFSEDLAVWVIFFGPEGGYPAGG